MSGFRYWKNQVPDPVSAESDSLSRFPSFSFLDSVQMEGPNGTLGNTTIVESPIPAPALPLFMSVADRDVRLIPTIGIQTPGRSRRPSMAPVPNVKWKVVDLESQDGNSSDMPVPMGDEEEDAEYDPESESSSGSEDAKENASPSPTRSADFAKLLSLKTKKSRSRGSEVTYGRLAQPEKKKVLKARIKELQAQHETHKEKVKMDKPSAKESKHIAEGKVNLETPKMMVTAEKVFTCEVCQKTFGLKSTLKQHSRIHLEPSPFRCTTCERVFKSAAAFAAHGRVHKGENPYLCITCGKPFTIKSSFDKHCLTHVPKAPKPYLCSFCQVSYANKGSLARHQKTKHGVIARDEVPQPIDIPLLE